MSITQWHRASLFRFTRIVAARHHACTIIHPRAVHGDHATNAATVGGEKEVAGIFRGFFRIITTAIRRTILWTMVMEAIFATVVIIDNFNIYSFG